MEKACFFRIMRCFPFVLRGLTGLVFTIVLVAPLSFIFAEDVASGEPAAETIQSAVDTLNRVENSVVKIFATARYPDLFKPWTKQAPQEVTSSGVIIEGKRILTNAHVILYASQVQVQANQGSDKISATVEAIAPGIDLAVLKLEDETFFNTRLPLERANHLPDIEDAVMAYGFPIGGSNLSTTKGIVSRIEFVSYSYSVSGLRIQIDAAINPGNSGGPAVADGRMIGLAFSHLAGTQNIGYIIPCEEIELFLQDISDGKYDGKPALFDEFQTLENPALRSFLKLDKAVEGIIVHQPFRTDTAYPLKEWDVITKVGDRRIDNEGMIKVNANLRVRFQYLIQKIAKNAKVPLTVVRAGKTLAVDVPVASTRPMLIPFLEGTYPSYFVYGPLVFSNATIEFIGGLRANPFGMQAFPSSPLMARMFDVPSFDGEELVVVSSPFFPHKLAKGYSNPFAEVVKTVNDIPIKNLRHLVEVLRDSRAEFIKFEFSLRGGETLVFTRKEMLAATEEILADNDIRAQGSPETLAVWNARPSR
jgi:S1-C subfamily serine protease